MTDRPELEQIDHETPDQRDELLSRLKTSVPEAFSDGKLDVEALQALLGDKVEDGPERFTFTWAGKRDAMAMLQAPSSATLAPDPDNSINFDEAQHVFIEGENLEVLKVLYRSYFGRVKLIYIDPPYNTGNHFIYPDNFADPLDYYLKLTGQRTQDGDDTTSNTETAGRLHSGWLSMMYPRLSLARQLLREDGFIVISIDDDELPNLTRLMDELYGEENRVAVLVYDRNRKNDAKLFSVGHEYMVVYARNRSFLKELQTQLRAPKEGVEEVRAEFDRLRKQHKDDWGKVREGILEFYKTFEEDDPRKPLARYRKVDERGPYRSDGNPSWPGSGGPRYDVLHPETKKPVKVPSRGWVWPTRERMQIEIDNDMICFGVDESTTPGVRMNLFEKDNQVMHSVTFSYAQTASQQFDAIFDDVKVFENPKSFTDLERLVSYLSEPGDTVLDFFAGTATSFHGLLRANRETTLPRKMISVQMPEPIKPGKEAANNALKMGFKTIADIARERIRRVYNSDEHKDEVLGLRAFSLKETNLMRWSGVDSKDPNAYAAQLEAFTDSLAPGWQPQDVIWEVALREGYSLTATVEELDISTGPTFCRVSDEDRSFTICLDEALTLDAVAPLGLTKDDMFVCRDTALHDTLAANLALQCRLKVI
ncbi:site-specific DNA-methyltransferase [Thioclava sp. F28-4]|uniref:site-specific DNA-methyltransferase n=1 Tax=Thioclava sp. F28-4 TaxID=1915315 RepID=UPI0009981343|nr:site-specific DNA-methyltransferase [Thioclava sp. F28-4]OOY05872.1 hypothetical protein BMI87_07665 [Thioclava sp. F28-4]